MILQGKSNVAQEGRIMITRLNKYETEILERRIRQFSENASNIEYDFITKLITWGRPAHTLDPDSHRRDI